ncbi:methyltransferase domain-containing protein [Streptomyces sp. KL2]|uniref:methyltransferase domain-containing protein n=1 Tax=Streptomyces sp. KL2 TaxID=3050126 RepID=UPI00397E8F08
MSRWKAVPAGAPRVGDEAYRHALDRFLAGTDEKTVTHAYLDRVLGALPARRVFLDVGPADGTTTRHLGRFFESTVCVEPSEPMRRTLKRTCPDARVVAEPVLRARPGVRADLALLSHVLYYIPRPQWTATVLRIMEWVAPGGLLLVLLQNPDNACMRMVRHFTGSRFDLRELVDELTAAPAHLVGDTSLDTVPARYRSGDLDETVAAAGFHLGVPSSGSAAAPPADEAVRDYVLHHFSDGSGGFEMSHEQDVLHIRRPY